MVNEQTTGKVIGLEIQATRLTAEVLKAAMRAYLSHKDRGQMSVKKLMQKNEKTATIEITDKNIKSFERIARKYGIDFAVEKDKTQDPQEKPKYIVYFKARDAEIIERAFKEYTHETLNKDKDNPGKERTSVKQKLDKFKEQLKHRQRERSPRRERQESL